MDDAIFDHDLIYPASDGIPIYDEGHPFCECPGCGEDGPMLGRLGMIEQFACPNGDCRVSEFLPDPGGWRGGQSIEDFRERVNED